MQCKKIVHKTRSPQDQCIFNFNQIFQTRFYINFALHLADKRDTMWTKLETFHGSKGQSKKSYNAYENLLDQARVQLRKNKWQMTIIKKITASSSLDNCHTTNLPAQKNRNENIRVSTEPVRFRLANARTPWIYSLPHFQILGEGHRGLDWLTYQANTPGWG